MELRPGYATLGFLGRADGRCDYAGGEEVLLYSIWIGPGAFDHFCEAVCGGRSAGFRAFQTDGYNCRSFLSDAREESILHRLDALLSEGADPLNRLLLESHLLELISINMEKLLCGDCRRGGLEALTRTDRAQLDHAREILLRRLDHPPSLVELSRMLHMNDCKLKRAFKAYHGQTVYEFVRGQRLERAFSLLERGGCNVSEAAFAVGYTNVSHFSEAFCRQFGVLPRALCKTGRSHTR